jgi:hypothetical protein
VRFDATLPRSEIASLGRLRDAPRRCFIAETHTTAGNREHNTRALPTCSGLNVPNVKLGALSSPPPWGLVAGTRGGGTAPALGFMVLLFGVGPRCERDCEPGMGRVRQGGAGGGGGQKASPCRCNAHGRRVASNRKNEMAAQAPPDADAVCRRLPSETVN